MKISVLFGLAAVAQALTSITTKGNAFYQGNTRFFIRGVDYQPGGSSSVTDPLADADTCKRDIAKFKDLGLNTIRVYAVDNSKDHSDCMKALDDAGIYLVLDLNTPKSSIARSGTACSYNAAYLQNIWATVDAFANYDNVLGFFAGNEVINDDNTTATAKYVKAVIRDTKTYMAARKYRAIPIGYSAADVEENRLEAALYFNCGGAGARADFFGINDYSWCGDSSYTTSGYSEKVKMYSNISIPMFLSEFGCNKGDIDRPFTEIKAIYSDDMAKVFSGGLVYEYSQEDNGYGLVKIDSDTEVDTMDDYNNLKKQYASVKNPSGNDATSSNPASTCPAVKPGSWESDDKLPNMPKGAQRYIKSGAGKAGGIDYDTITLCKGDSASSGFTDSSQASAPSGNSDSSSSSSSSSSPSSSSSTKSGDDSDSTSSSSKSAAPAKFGPVNKVLLIGGLYAAVAAGCGFMSVF